MNWDVDELIREYSTGRQDLIRRADQLDRSNPSDMDDLEQVNKMIESMSYSIEWMETGRQPGTFRGADKKKVYQRQYFEGMDLIPDIKEQLDINQKHLFISTEEKIILADIFASLSHRERQCFILHVAQKKSMGEIADEIGVSKSTVQIYINRAKKKVEEKVA